MTQAQDDLEVLVKVDDICEEFQSDFAQGKSPRVANFLRRVEPAHCSLLLRELMRLEAALRAENGERVSADAMIEEFSDLLSEEFDRELLKSDIEKALAATDRRAGVTETAMFGQQAERGKNAAPPLPRVAGFEIESILGRGGMGVVYRARQASLNRTVALKMIVHGSEFDRQHLARFQKEAQAIAELNDPHFVQIYEFGEIDTQPYMALEYVEGGSLEEYRQGEPQSAEFAARIVETLARAMESAHAAGLVHRDLKPHNVLLTDDMTPKITDFGLVKRQDQEESQLTQQGTVMGTASYMAPEQSRGDARVGPVADVHALGAILYCLLTGRPPFLAATVYDTILQVRNEAPVPPSRLHPGLSQDLETICLKCLEKEVGRRYASSAELADDLGRYLAGHPIIARPVSLAEHGWRWAKRNRWVAGLGTSVAALLVAVAVVSAVMSWQLSIKTDEALQKAEEARVAQVKAEAAQEEATRKAEAARVAEEKANRENNRATATANMTLSTIRSVLQKVDTTLRNDRNQFLMRQAIIEIAADSLDQLREYIETNPLEQRTGAMVHQRLGDNYRAAFKLQKALGEYSKSHDIISEIAEQNPDDEVHQFNLAIAANKLGELHWRLGNTLKTRAYYQEGLRLRQRRLEIIPADLQEKQQQCQEAIAESHSLVGSIHIALGEPAAAFAQYQSALQVWESLPRGISRRLQNFRRHTNVLQMMGETSYQLGDPEQAEQWLNRALARRLELFQKRPDLASIHDLCRTRLAIGDFYIFGRKDNQKAWGQYKLVFDHFHKMWEADPELARTRTDLATVNYRLGATLQRAAATGTHIDDAGAAEPQPYLEAACSLREGLAGIDPSDLQSGIEWALALARSGRAEKAEEVADALAEKGQGNPRLLSQSAYTLALCSNNSDSVIAERCRRKALQRLRECVAAGWKDWVALRDDPDLDPIRDEPEFQQLQQHVTEATATVPG